uniref:Bacterial Pleckstrin homology domain-containing protein n=1 Tax=Candidatus Methanomethylicus mesodigestus TaxID=1867258 RepID=A0A7C3EX09_9CREN
MSSIRLYEETIHWRMIILLSIFFSGLMVGSVYFALSTNDEDAGTAILIMAIVLAVMATVMLTFSRLSITITGDGVKVGFGRIIKRFPWDAISGCYQDDASAVRYGGYGIKGGKHKGKTRMVFNVTNAPRVVLVVKGAKFDEFVFSTKRPDEVIRIITSQMKG